MRIRFVAVVALVAAQSCQHATEPKRNACPTADIMFTPPLRITTIDKANEQINGLGNVGTITTGGVTYPLDTTATGFSSAHAVVGSFTVTIEELGYRPARTWSQTGEFINTSNCMNFVNSVSLAARF